MREPPPDIVTRLRRLPQARHFTDRQAEAWAAELWRQQTTDALGGLTLEQHLRRLGGFGASEIGILVEEGRGIYSPFAVARELVARKLLLQFPTPNDEHLSTGQNS